MLIKWLTSTDSPLGGMVHVDLTFAWLAETCNRGVYMCAANHSMFQQTWTLSSGQ